MDAQERVGTDERFGHTTVAGESAGAVALPLPRTERPLTVEQRQERDIVARVRRETAGHTARVLHEDGLYRHLRFMDGGSSFYWFDIITWPGALAIDGDCGSFLFRRSRDMFEFFEASGGRINPHYWAQKLQAPAGRRAVREYSHEALTARVLEWAEYQAEDMDDDEAADLRHALNEQILCHEEVEWSEESAGRLLRDFEHGDLQISDAWEWDITEWDWQFLWCCAAITEGIARYRFAESYR